MLKIVQIALVSTVSSVIAFSVAGANLTEVLIGTFLIPSAVVGLWLAGTFIADHTWRPILDAKKVSRHVCPSCNAIGSLREAISADKDTRLLECPVCEESFSIFMTERGIEVERMGRTTE